MTYVRVDKLEDGSIAIDASEGMSKGDAVHLLEIGRNEAAISPDDQWAEPALPDDGTVASEG